MEWRRGRLAGAGAPAVEIVSCTAPLLGPVLAILGGVHGDEPEGVFAADALTRTAPVIERGSLVVVPVAHPAAFAADARCGPGGGNLARAFPGDPAGTPVERLAAALASEVLAGADALVDLHTAGRAFDMPLLAGYVETGAAEVDAVSRRMARAFGADFLWRHREGAPGRTLSVMGERGKPAIYVEAAGGEALSWATLERYRAGLRGVMAALDMTGPPPSQGDDPRAVEGPGDLDRDAVTAPQAGYFTALVAAGDRLERGQTAGWILARGRDPLPVTAAQDGIVMFLRRRARVAPGDPLLLTAALEGRAP